MVQELLTARERQVLCLIVAGRSTREIAADLSISFKTAACHRSHILSKTAALNTADLVRLSIRRGLLADPRSNGDSAGPVLESVPPSLGLQARVAALCEESRRSRALLSGSLSTARQLRLQSRMVRREFRESWAVTVERCQELLKNVGPSEPATPSGPKL
jgi:DNA-binding CsgD family transcriptional regulator